MDPIKAAKTKAAKKWAKLDSETVPLYENLSTGKATEADIQKLSKLYKAQSKLASDTFNEALDAARESTRQSVRKTIRSSVKAKQLLSTPELKRLLETTSIVVLQKSADIIRVAVNEALDGTLERVERLIRDVRRMQVKNDEVLVRLRQGTFGGFFSSGAAPTNAKDKAAAAKIASANRQDKRSWLSSLFGKKNEVAANIIDTPEKLAEAVSNKVISSIAVLEKFRAQAQQNILVEALSSTDSKSVKARLLQAKSTSEEFLQRAIDYLGENKRKISDYIFNKDSFAYKSFIRILNSEADIQSEYTVRTAEQVDSMDKLEEAVYNYQKLDKDYRDDELEQARREEANFSDNLFTAVAKAIDRVTGGSVFEEAQVRFAKSVAELNHDNLEDVQADLDIFAMNLESKIAQAEKDRTNPDSRKNARLYNKAYERYRSIVMRDLKRQWNKEAKTKLDYIRRRIKRQTTRISKIFKWFTVAYLASVVINSLNSFIPTWKEDLWDWVTGTGADYLKESGEQVGSLLGTAITSTLGFILDHKVEILNFLFGVVKGMMKSIVKAGLSLFGIDYDKVFGQTPEQAEQRKLGDSASFESAEYRSSSAGEFKDSPVFQEIKKKYDLDSADSNMVLYGAADSLAGTPSSSGYDLGSIAAEVEAVRTKWNLDRKAAEEAAKKAAEDAKPSLAERAKNAISNTFKTTKDAASTAKNAMVPYATDAKDAVTNFGDTVYNTVTPLYDKGMDLAGNAVDSTSNLINNTIIPRISAKISNDNPFAASPFVPGASQPLVDTFNSLKGNAANAAEKVGQMVNTNILDNPVAKKAKDTAANLAATTAQLINGTTDSIATFMPDGMFLQDAGLLS